MKDITDTVSDVCMVRQCNVLHDSVTVAMLPNGLQLHLCCVLYGRLLFLRDITITSALDCMSRTDQSSSSRRCLYRHQLTLWLFFAYSMKKVKSHRKRKMPLQPPNHQLHRRQHQSLQQSQQRLTKTRISRNSSECIQKSSETHPVDSYIKSQQYHMTSRFVENILSANKYVVQRCQL